jgi:hypothetical protein
MTFAPRVNRILLSTARTKFDIAGQRIRDPWLDHEQKCNPFEITNCDLRRGRARRLARFESVYAAFESHPLCPVFLTNSKFVTLPVTLVLRFH